LLDHSTISGRAAAATSLYFPAMSDRIPLELHIPAPHTRPGDEPSFDHLEIPMAGTAGAGGASRPDPDVAAARIQDLAYGLIRVLGDDALAVGAWDPGLTSTLLLRGLRAMLLTRMFDDRMFRAHRQGKCSFYIKSAGEEAIGAAQSLMLDGGDMCFPTYRMLSWLMARDYPLTDLVNQVFSNAACPLRGRQLPVLYSARSHGFYSISGNLGSRFGHAVGWAMASAYKHDRRIAIGYIGEGTTAEGDFHEALTFASVYRAPVILCVTNNQYAISTYQGIAAGDAPTFAAKAIGFGIPGLRVDGNDFLAIAAATRWAAERARTNHGPTLIELFTYRAEGHSTSDDPTRYRPEREPAAWPLGDPIERLKHHLIRSGDWSEARHAALTQELAEAVRTAVKEGESIGTLGQSKPDARSMFEGVFKEPDWRLREQMREFGG
jgi:2-oxoisovalerate dehydrogenase E1 component alpha subunit